jgi:diacylglycerol O-acyltransferase / wax synthase
VQRLSGLDAGFLYMDTPTLHMHTVKVAVLDPPPAGALPFAETRDLIARHLVALPPLRRRVLPVPGGLHHPVWVDDPDLDLDYHVRRAEVAPPGDRAALRALVAEAASVPLDRSRPLWRVHACEGLADGSVAVVVVIHHAVADGVAASALLTRALAGVEGQPPPVLPAAPPLPGPARLVADAIVDHVGQVARLPGLVADTTTRAWRLRRHRRHGSATTPPRPMRDTPRLSFNRAIGRRRTFATARLALADATEVRRAHGVTLNDVVLAVVAGALRSFLTGRGELPPVPLIAAVPVAADQADAAGERLGGNRLSTIFTSLATELADPVDRLLEIHRVTAEAKEEQRILGPQTFGSWVQYTPPRPYAWIVRQYSRRRLGDRLPPPVNLVVSNVPGPPVPLAAHGAVLRELVSVGPVLEGVGLNATVWSYADALHVGLLADGGLLPDLDLLADAMVPALAELVEAAIAGERSGSVAGRRALP